MSDRCCLPRNTLQPLRDRPEFEWSLPKQRGSAGVAAEQAETKAGRTHIFLVSSSELQRLSPESHVTVNDPLGESFPKAAPESLSHPDDLLTPREQEVLRLIAEGRSTKQIAAQLGIAFMTAVCHRTHIMEKLGIHELAGLVRYAVRKKLIEA